VDKPFESRGIAFCSLLSRGAGLALSARRIDCGVQAPEACDSPVDQTADIVLMANVGAEFPYQRIAGLVVGPMRRSWHIGRRNREQLRVMPVSAPVMRTTGLVMSDPYERGLWRMPE
jgi:hypothetical protein